MACLLADQRAGPYVVGVGGLLADVMREVKETHFKRACAADDHGLAAFCLVWYEQMETHDAARMRAAEIRNWPHRWQRRLVESVNPDWWERSQMESGFSRAFWQAIPEKVPLPKR
ncbi:MULTISPECIES: hypothetical protein [unclassified Lysobacter]|uniref:hypothetical protein n=1 Tax=unclassified Lysobacter TaxID=2635362 RepID=UPI001BE9E973|nr:MULTISPECIES: hypothetical protein [unclassified Lysobacter]MBT2746630.1 hypothetical protein [Lysobacter sp. ISL-42]MBT2753375.1 hypothetical protein [Lysobacter sp. ISL-50]MBT2775485.1 hypothetical protein [Lysobacter sp. ISL-54]MBT2782979.1 hypothetical protein [Lysobacter sp. ISL-52]